MSAADSAAYLEEMILIERMRYIEEYCWDYGIDYDYDYESNHYTLTISASMRDVEELIEIFETHEELLEMVDSLENEISVWEDIWSDASIDLLRKGIDLDKYLEY